MINWFKIYYFTWNYNVISVLQLKRYRTYIRLLRVKLSAAMPQTETCLDDVTPTQRRTHKQSPSLTRVLTVTGVDWLIDSLLCSQNTVAYDVINTSSVETEFTVYTLVWFVVLYLYCCNLTQYYYVNDMPIIDSWLLIRFIMHRWAMQALIILTSSEHNFRILCDSHPPRTMLTNLRSLYASRYSDWRQQH